MQQKKIPLNIKMVPRPNTSSISPNILSNQVSYISNWTKFLAIIILLYLLFAVCEEPKPKPKVPTIVSNPIQCHNRELKSSNALRGDFWVFYNYIPARGKM